MAIMDIGIKQGKTFTRTFRWGASPIIYKAITAISQAAPVQITVPAHGYPDGWPATVVSARGMTEINAPHSPPWPMDHHRLTKIDADTIQFNKVNSSDFTPYTAGGYVRAYTPVDLTNYVARMKIKDRIGGTVLVSLTSAAGDIVLDNTKKTIVVTISATATAGYTWTRGVFDIELENSMIPYTKELASGKVVVVREVTT
jgi:hypothetical protein